jgi:hypothetical protein
MGALRETHFWQVVRTRDRPEQFTRSALFICSLQRMHRARGGLAPSLISRSRPPSSVSRQLRERSTSSSKEVFKITKRAWIDSARTLLKVAVRRPGPGPPKSPHFRELRFVNSILDESSLPTAAELGVQSVVPPMASDLEECTSEIPSGVDPGTLVEVRL